MKKKVIYVIVIILMLVLWGIFLINDEIIKENIKEDKIQTLEVMVIAVDNRNTLVMDNNDIVYMLSDSQIKLEIGDMVMIEYTGVIDNNILDVVDYNLLSESTLELDSEDMFGDYYKMAERKLNELTLDEKIGQLILGRYDSAKAFDAVDKYGISGFVFYEQDFKDKSKNEVVEMIDNLQEISDIPLLTAVDEEGGKIVRISSNSNLVSERFKSSKELYLLGGMDEIRKDTISKSKILKELGINLNLAPVVDVSTDNNDYMYERSIGENTEITSMYAKTVINASKGLGVSYTLKHFPGYGNNVDTHTGVAIDNRSYEEILGKDIPPFESGINVGAEAVLISHNIVSSIDSVNPASLSLDIHNLLRGNLGFTGISITDDLYMGALDNIDDASIKALLSGNNLIISTDYEKSINEIKNGISLGKISEGVIDRSVIKVLAWKYYKGLIIDEK